MHVSGEMARKIGIGSEETRLAGHLQDTIQTSGTVMLETTMNTWPFMLMMS